MRNIEVMSDYYLGKDPQLEETLASNSLRLIGVEGRFFVQRDELLSKLQELKEYLDGQDSALAADIDNVIRDLQTESGLRASGDNSLRRDLNDEITARQSGDTTLNTKISNEKLARQDEDAALNQKINTEKQNRQNADTALDGRITTIENWKNNNNFVMLDDLTTALLNYYTKSQVDALIAAIPTLTYEVVAQLPTTNISTRTIYMVHPQGAEEPDYYNEYLYTGDPSQTYDPNKWELIGNTRVDLTDYYTKTEADALLAAKQNVLTPGSGISITSDTIKVDGEVIEVEEDVAVKNLNTGIYRIKGGHTISYTDVSGAEPLQYTHSVYMVVEAITISKKYFYILRGDTSVIDSTMIIDYGYTYQVVSSWVGGVSTIDIGTIYTSSNLTPGNNISISGGTIDTIGTPVKSLSGDIRIWNLADGLYQFSAQSKLYYSGLLGTNYQTMTGPGHMFVEKGTMSQGWLAVYTTILGGTYIAYGNNTMGSGTITYDVPVTNISGAEQTTNKVTSINEDSTDTQYPSAKLLYDQLQAKQSEIDQLYDQIPTATATGYNINIQDSSNLPIKEFDLLGNATQVNTTGKNLMPFTTQDFTKNGVRYYVQNGSLYLNGTSYGETSSTDQVFKDNFAFTLPSGTYTISHKTGIVGCYLRIYSPDSNYHTLSTNDNYWSFTIAEETKFNIGFYVYQNSFSNINTEIMIETGSSKTTYEPYTGGKASPNPDYPQDIHVVTGDNTFTINDKNLFNKSGTIRNTGECTGTETSNGIKTTANATGNSRYCLVEIPNSNDLLGKKVTIRAEWINSASNRGGFNIFQIKETGVNVKGVGVSAITTSGNSLTLTLPSSYFDETYVKFALALYVNTSGTLAVGDTTTFTNIQIEIGENATNCIPYQAPATQLISLGSIELAKIGDYTDRIFKAVSSNNPLKPSYYDTLPDSTKQTLTLGKWYVEKTINKVTFNGSESWSTWGNVNTCIGFYSSTYVSNALRYNNEAHINGMGLTNKFTESDARVDIVNGNIEAYKMCGGEGYPYLAIGIDKTRLSGTTANDFKTWLSSNNTTLYYVLSTPTITEITDTTLIGQLENILQMHTNKNVTNGWIEPSGTNAQAGLTLTYKQDLDTIITPGGGTSNYSDLSNKPQINGVTLSGNKTSSALGLLEAYSSTETVVGTWRNGKPLYQVTAKVAMPETLTTGSASETSIALSDDIDFAFVKYAVFADETGNSPYTQNLPMYRYYTTGIAETAAYITLNTGNKAVIVTNSDNMYTSSQYVYITYCYTKSTD